MQLTYRDEPEVASVGLVSEPFSLNQVDSYLADEAIPFGFPVEVSSAPGVGRVGGVSKLASGECIGVAVASLPQEQAAGTADAEYRAEAALPVLTYGRCWVKASAAIALGAEVVPADTGKFSGATATGVNVRMVAKTAADADGDLFMVEIFPQITA